MLTNLLILTGLIVLVAILLWSTYRWGRRLPNGQDSFSRDFLVGLGRGMGLDEYTEREYFGERIQVLAGTFERLGVELEVSSGEYWRPYTRVTIEFPKSLAQDLAIYSGDREPFGNQARGLDEFKLGDPEFDASFVSFGREPDRGELILTDAIRYQLLRMNALVDDMRVTDSSLFLFTGETLDRERLKGMLKKAVELGDRLFDTAEAFGPRIPEKGSGHYENATLKTTLRTTSGESDERPLAE